MSEGGLRRSQTTQPLTVETCLTRCLRLGSTRPVWLTRGSRPLHLDSAGNSKGCCWHTRRRPERSLSLSLSLSSLPFSLIFSDLFSPPNNVQSTDQPTRRPMFWRSNVVWRTVGSQHLPTNCTECCHVCDGSLLLPSSSSKKKKKREGFFFITVLISSTKCYRNKLRILRFFINSKKKNFLCNPIF